MGNTTVRETRPATGPLLKWLPSVLLGIKPTVDILWSVEFGEIFGQRINIPSIFTICIAFLGLLLLPVSIERLSPPLFLLGVVATVSLLIWQATSGLGDVIRLWSLILLGSFATVFMNSRDMLLRFMGIHIASVAALSVVLVLQMVGLWKFFYFDYVSGIRIGRPSGGLPHPLGYVFVAIPAIIFSHSLARYRLFGQRSISRRLFRLLAYWFSLTCVLTTHRMGGLVAVLVLASLEIGSSSSFQYRAGRRNRRVLVFLGAMVLGAAALWERIARSFSFVSRNDGNFSLDKLSRGRAPLFRFYLRDFYEGGPSQWLIGKGSSFRENVSGGILGEPHNDLLRLTVSFGLVGLLLFVAFLLSVWRWSVRLRHTRNHHSEIAAQVLSLLVLATIILSLSTEPSRYPSGLWSIVILGSTAHIWMMPVPIQTSQKAGVAA